MIRQILTGIEALRSRELVKRVAELFFNLFHLALSRIPWGQGCPVCGAYLITVSRPVVGEELAKEMNLDEFWISSFNERDGTICISCGGALRVRRMASEFLKWLASSGIGRYESVRSASRCRKTEVLCIAEINSCGALHKYLAAFPNVKYSEFGSTDPQIPDEDFLNFSYPDDAFDFVFHSDTLEHVPDVEKALSELHRILKPGGVSIFTVPLVRDGRENLKRAELRDGKIVHLRRPSYHGGSFQATKQYLVFYEFGEAFVRMLEEAGFETTLSEWDNNPTAVTFICRKTVTKGKVFDRSVG